MIEDPPESPLGEFYHYPDGWEDKPAEMPPVTPPVEMENPVPKPDPGEAPFEPAPYESPEGEPFREFPDFGELHTRDAPPLPPLTPDNEPLPSGS